MKETKGLTEDGLLKQTTGCYYSPSHIKSLKNITKANRLFDDMWDRIKDHRVKLGDSELDYVLYDPWDGDRVYPKKCKWLVKITVNGGGFNDMSNKVRTEIDVNYKRVVKKYLTFFNDSFDGVRKFMEDKFTEKGFKNVEVTFNPSRFGEEFNKAIKKSLKNK